MFMDNIFLRTLGNSPFIGKSCILIDIPSECMFLLDYGMTTESGSTGVAKLSKSFNHNERQICPLSADFMLVSHGHSDHCAGLTQCEYDGPMYGTEITRQLSSQKIQPIQYHKKYYIQSTHTYFIATPAGHIPGACIFTIVTPVATIVYTGDFQLNANFLLSGAELPPEAYNCDILITETTFASTAQRSEHYAALMHFQQCAIQAALRRPAIHPVTSTGMAQQLAAQISQFGSRLGMSGFEITAGQTKQAHQNFIMNQNGGIRSERGLLTRDSFRDFQLFNRGHQQLSPQRKIVLTSPQKLIGGATLDLLFESLEVADSLLVLSGGCRPGTMQWRMLFGTLRELKRDNMRDYARMLLQVSIIGSISHADAIEIIRVITIIKPRLIIGTHCSQLENMDVMRELVEKVLPRSRFCVLGPSPIVVKCQNVQTSSLSRSVFRMQLTLPINICLMRLRQIGVTFQQKEEVWYCGGITLTEGIMCFRGSPMQYKRVFEVLDIDFKKILTQTQ